MDRSGDAAAVSPGWYPDPAERYELRYHNGSRWTADVATDGTRLVDPSGIAPGLPAAPPPDTPRRGRAIAALVLGIVAICLGWVPLLFVVAAICGLLAVVLGGTAWRATPRRSSTRAVAVAGTATGAAGIGLCVVGLWFTIAVLDAVDRFRHPEPQETRVESCDREGDTTTAVVTISNTGGRTADYSVRVDFAAPGTANAARTVRVAVDDLAPGQPRTFEVTRIVPVDDVECSIGRVDGPLPFGLEP